MLFNSGGEPQNPGSAAYQNGTLSYQDDPGKCLSAVIFGNVCCYRGVLPGVHPYVLRTLRIRPGTRSPDQLADCTNRVTPNQGCNAGKTDKNACISARFGRKTLLLVG